MKAINNGNMRLRLKMRLKLKSSLDESTIVSETYELQRYAFTWKPSHRPPTAVIYYVQ